MGRTPKRVQTALLGLAVGALLAAAVPGPARAGGSQGAPAISQYVEVVPTSSGGVSQGDTGGSTPPGHGGPTVPLKTIATSPSYGAPTTKLNLPPSEQSKLRTAADDATSPSTLITIRSLASGSGRGDLVWLAVTLVLTTIVVLRSAVRGRSS